MRNHNLFIAFAVTSSLLGACKWTDFDDLEDQTWAHSTENPEIGAKEYAVAIAGVTTASGGGLLAVVSNNVANYSTLEYDAEGNAAVGDNPLDLGSQRISTISESPIFATSGGTIGIVERSTMGGNFAVVFGSATAPTSLEFAAAVNPAPVPDAATFVPNATDTDVELLFAAGNSLYIVALFGGSPKSCTGMDNNAMPLQVAAMSADADGNNLWVWTKSGSLISYPLATAMGATLCDTDGILPAPEFAFTPTTAVMPGPGARVHIAGSHAILTGSPSTSRTGSVLVMALSTTANPTQVGTTLTVEGLRTSTLAVLGGETYLVLGVPERQVDGIAAGEVDLHAFNATTGVLEATPALSLHDAQPDSGQLFGRTVTSMEFNGSPILVVGADSEIFAYYRTTLYDQLP